MIAAVLAATCSTLVPDSSSATTVTPGHSLARASRRPWRARMKLLAARKEIVPISPASQAGVGVVAALILAVLVAEVVPIGAEIGQALGHRQVAVGDHGRHLLVDALVDLGGQRVVPAADDDHARRVLGALGIDRGDEGGEVDRGRAGDAHLDVERLARRLEPRIDPLDEQRQVRGVADPDIFLVAAAGVADRHVQARSGLGACA